MWTTGVLLVLTHCQMKSNKARFQDQLLTLREGKMGTVNWDITIFLTNNHLIGYSSMKLGGECLIYISYHNMSLYIIYIYDYVCTSAYVYIYRYIYIIMYIYIYIYRLLAFHTEPEQTSTKMTPAHVNWRMFKGLQFHNTHGKKTNKYCGVVGQAQLTYPCWLLLDTLHPFKAKQRRTFQPVHYPTSTIFCWVAGIPSKWQKKPLHYPGLSKNFVYNI